MTRRYLSEADLSSFRRDGSLVIRQMYSHREIAELSRWIDELVARRHEIANNILPINGGAFRRTMNETRESGD